MTTLQHIVAKLPLSWHDPIRALASDILQSDVPLRLTLVGSFSVGKSSLLNMLLGARHLFTALEEATALPTFIEYAEQATWQLIDQNGTTTSIDAPEFARITTAPPHNAAYALLGLPIDWLRGITIIDLPGLGSTSQARCDYALSQIQQSDAILYLLQPKGPGKEDIQMLKDIRRYGKRVKILVSRWDEIETSIARDKEKAPDLTQWAALIERETGIRARLVPASQHGLGKDDVLDFIARAREDLVSIRQQRLLAELRPLLENALGQNEIAQQACETNSEESIRALHTQFIGRKTALLNLKQELHQRQSSDRERLDLDAQQTVEQCRSELAQKLAVSASEIRTEQDWPAFCEQGSGELREALTSTATLLSALSSSYGELQLAPATIEILNLRLPVPEVVDSSDFLDIARLTQLQIQLDARQNEFSSREKTQMALSEVDNAGEKAIFQALLSERAQIAATELPRILQRSETGNAAAIGKMLGGVADIGLIFLPPVGVAAGATKIASLLGKGAKTVNIAVNATQIARNVGKGIKIVQDVNSGTNKVRGIPAPVMAKIGFLEILSLSYWGERIGGMIDGTPVEHEVIDPAARAEQEQALANIDRQLALLRRELHDKEDIANERQLNGSALEKNRQEQARLARDMQRLQSQAEQRKREAEAEMITARQDQIHQQAQRVMRQWLGSYKQQAEAMAELLRARARQHWVERVDATLETNLAELASFEFQMNAAPQKKAAELARLKDEADRINDVLQDLSA